MTKYYCPKCRDLVGVIDVDECDLIMCNQCGSVEVRKYV
jgi:DNA-directed RNA polymerase subunit RPC12/RpoP